MGFFEADRRITWRNNRQTLKSVSSVQVLSGDALSHPINVSSKKDSCCWEAGEALGLLCLGKTANGKKEEEEHLKMRQPEWNIPLQVNCRSSTAVRKQKVLTLPLYSPLHHRPPPWGNDSGETTSEKWAFGSSKCAVKHECFYENLWHYHLHMGNRR